MNRTLTASAQSGFEPVALTACFHCGLPVPAGATFQAEILGRSRSLCCAGCEAVAQTIVEAGFSSYYETRDAPDGAGLRPVDLPPVSMYDDPLAQRQFVAAVGEHGREASLALEGIRCAACVWLNERFLRQMPGVTGVTINYATRRAQVAWDDRLVRLGQIIGAVRSLGYEAFPFDPDQQRARDRTDQRAALWRLFVAGFGAMQVMMYAVPRYIDDSGTLSAESEQVMRWASLVLTVPVILFACGPFFSSALADFRARRLGMDVPVSLGIVAGFGASAWSTLTGGGEVYFDSITMLAFLLLGSRYLESSARRKASSRLDYLSRWMPSFALRLRSGLQAERIPAYELRAGDEVLVAPGETVPADGLVRSGESSADESLMTGESRPAPKEPGSPLVGGSVNLSQPLVMRVTHAGMNTQAAAIGRLIERAAAGKPRLVQSADRIAGALTWIVLAAAAAALSGWISADPSRAFWAAIAVLMVACPCALGLAAPIALTSATGALARRGIVMTRARAIEALSSITDVVLDKTGTLTTGKPALLHIEPMGARTPAECLRLAGALESASAHPIARAFIAAAGHGPLPAVSGATHYPGSGIEAALGEERIRIGSFAFVGELAGSAGLPAAAAGQSPVYLGGESGWFARFLFGHELRPGAMDLVNELHAQGLTVHLLSGDDPAVVAGMAGTLGVRLFAGGRSPRDKHDYVVGLQAEGRRVAMIGDGLNDAPVLAQADVSIAMGQGATLAQQQADLVLVSGRLAGVVQARGIARLAMTVVKQNFTWALAYNAAAIPAAALGLIGPWEAAIGMAASSLIVVANSGRLMAALR